MDCAAQCLFDIMSLLCTMSSRYCFAMHALLCTVPIVPSVHNALLVTKEASASRQSAVSQQTPCHSLCLYPYNLVAPAVSLACRAVKSTSFWEHKTLSDILPLP